MTNRQKNLATLLPNKIYTKLLSIIGKKKSIFKVLGLFTEFNILLGYQAILINFKESVSYRFSPLTAVSLR